METIFLGKGHNFVISICLSHNIQIGRPLDISNSDLDMLLKESHHSVDSWPAPSKYHHILWSDARTVA